MLILTFRHSLSCSASVHSFCKVLFSKATPTLNMLRAPFHIGFQMRFRAISSQKYVAQKCCIFYVRFPTEKETWYFADALYTWSFTVTSLMVQACSLMPCRSRFKVYVLCLLILSAAHQSGSPLSCVGDVTINLPGILEENV